MILSTTNLHRAEVKEKNSLDELKSHEQTLFQAL